MELETAAGSDEFPDEEAAKDHQVKLYLHFKENSPFLSRSARLWLRIEVL